MLKAVFESKIENMFKCNQLLSAGTIVKQDPANAGFLIPAVAGDANNAVYLLAQDMVSSNVDNYKLTSVTHKAVAGVDQVGAYFGDGVFITDQYVGAPSAGAQLYIANGQFTTTASGNAVAIAETAGTSGGTMRIRTFG